MKPWMVRGLVVLLVALGLLVLRPAASFCFYCQGGTPCFSQVDCSLGCQCLAAPYTQGVCVSQ